MKTQLALAALLALALAPTASAAPQPECLDVYNEWTAGPVTVVQRTSCSVPEVYLHGEPVLDRTVEPATLSTSGPECMPVYREHEVGPVRVVQRNSCSAEVYLFGEPLLR